MKPNFKKAGYVSPRKRTPKQKSPANFGDSLVNPAQPSPSTQQHITDFFPSTGKSRNAARPKKALCLSVSKRKLFPPSNTTANKVLVVSDDDDDWDNLLLEETLKDIEAKAFENQLPQPPPPAVKIVKRKKWAHLSDMSDHVEGVVSGSQALLFCISSCSRFATVIFDEDTEKIAAKYQSALEPPEQMLYFYLFMRKWKWISLSKIRYDFVANVQSSVSTLEEAGLLEALTEDAALGEILSILKAPDLKTLCKRYKLDEKARHEQMIASLLKTSSRKSFFTNADLKKEMAKQAFKLLGEKCVRLVESPRKLFMKMAVTACSPLVFEGKSYTFNERFNALKDKLDEVHVCPKKLPRLKVSSIQLFNTPFELEQYTEAVTLKLEIFHLQDIKKHDEASKKVFLALEEFKAFLNNEACLASLERRPRHLWKFSSGYNYASAVKEGVDILKRTNNYEKALEAIDLLLGQTYFIKHARGSWYSERALILDKYLGRGGAQEEYETLVRGLSEADLSVAGRRSLLRRAEIVLNRKIRGLSNESKHNIKQLMEKEQVLSWPVNAFYAKTAEEGGPMKRVVYVQTQDTAKAFMSVEEIAMSHYQNARGFSRFVHDEGALLKHLVITAFSSVIYNDSIEGVFVTKLQDAPLDWGSSSFYDNRWDAIQALCATFQRGGVDAILSEINSSTSSGIPLIKNDLVSPGTTLDLHDFLHCLGVEQFLKLSNYLLENFRARRSGLPDLTLWDMPTKRVLFAEVKSPTDNLSVTQEIWLHKLNEFGIPAEECRINEPKNKKKRKILEESSEIKSRKTKSTKSQKKEK